MFWAKKPTREQPYAESRDGNYRIAVTFHGKLADGSGNIKYAPFFRGKSIGPCERDVKLAKATCVLHARENKHGK